MNLRELFKQARDGTLPTDFDRWDLADEQGWSVAHEAAHCNNLPRGFDQWDLADYRGWTVAHEAAAHGGLPKDFTGGHWQDRKGTTVYGVVSNRRWREKFWGEKRK